MISQIKQQGFTIVELLIVIVVIAILAALSYVGYTSITARANTSTAAASAKAVKDAAQTFNGTHGAWPINKLAMVNGYPSGGSAADAVAKLPNDITFVTSTSAAAATTAQGVSDAKSVVVVPYGSPIVGFTIYYKDFSGTVAKSVTVGDVSGTAATNAMN